MAEDTLQLTTIVKDVIPTWSQATPGSTDSTGTIKSNLQWLTLFVLVAAAGLIYLCLRLRRLRWWPQQQADIAPSALLDINGLWLTSQSATQHYHTSFSRQLPLVRFSEPAVVEEPMSIHHREWQRHRQQYQGQGHSQQQQQWTLAARGRRHHRRRRRSSQPRTPPPAYLDASSYPPPAYDDDVDRSHQ